MQLVNRGHRSSSTVSADGQQLPPAATTGPADIALMRWPSHGFTAIPVEPDDSVSTGSSSADDGSLEGTTRRPSAAATASASVDGRPIPGSRWRRTTPPASQHHQQGHRRSKQQRHSDASPAVTAPPSPPLVAASSTSCLRECLLCRCCRSGQYALSLGSDQTSSVVDPDRLGFGFTDRDRGVCDTCSPSFLRASSVCFDLFTTSLAKMDEQKEASDQEEGNYECKYNSAS
ncbi:Sec7 [Anopheles sinensis]|uniref:Sec7 n=1 Tax=Anopheles sinensis TaxID=74873 RepID=A0A084WNZ4_ANOSI|nr:Sec7 [Anopheles sinensis]